MTDVVAHETLAAALVAAQADMPKVEPNATNPHFKSRFVSLGHLVSKVRPVLNRHGLAFAQFPSHDANGKPTLVTRLIHKSGECLEYAAPLIPTKNDPQGLGSAITYMRRYALAAALGIVDQEDDDGQAASTPKTSTNVPAPSRDTTPASVPSSIVVGSKGRELTIDEYVSALIVKIADAGIKEYVRPKLADLGVKPAKGADLRDVLARLDPKVSQAFAAWVSDELAEKQKAAA